MELLFTTTLEYINFENNGTLFTTSLEYINFEINGTLFTTSLEYVFIKFTKVPLPPIIIIRGYIYIMHVELLILSVLRISSQKE